MSTAQARIDPKDVVIRGAEPADNARLCDIFESVSMKSDLHLTSERDPDFFALYDMETDARDRFVCAFEARGEVHGVGTFLARDAHLLGETRRVGYLGDLRFDPTLRGFQCFRSIYRSAFEEGSRQLGVDLYTTVIFDSNGAAQKALVARDPRWPDKPLYRPLRNFTILSVQLAHHRPIRDTGYSVRRAEERDLPRIVELLARDQAARPFGYVVNEAFLRARLARWPRLGIESFYLAFDRRDHLVGVTAVWDAFDVKRYRVLGVYNRMRWLKRGYGLLSRVLRSRPLPEPGELMRYFYLTHLAVPSNDPAIMAALVDRVYADYLRRGYHFFFVYVAENDPLAPAFRGYITMGMPATVYTVCAPESPFANVDFGPGRPGFEMALA